MKKGILLVNLGTPDSPSPGDVRRYLDEFLMDGRVIDKQLIQRNLLVRGIIVPFRTRNSAKIYKKIWTDEGSPLLIYGENVKSALQQELGERYHVVLGMRYQKPSIEKALNELKSAGVDSILVLALFPQYASATTGSVHQRVMEIVSKWQTIPDIRFVNSFHDHPGMIRLFADNARKYDLSKYDHVLFSFHGLPKRHLIKADETGSCCMKDPGCCNSLRDENRYCYSAQCYDTARLIAGELQISPKNFSVCFQSRLGKDPWIEPYTSEVIQELAKQGKKRLLVFCPAFVADCLETIYEIGEEYQEEFAEAGGEKVQLVESLNDHPQWIQTLKEIVDRYDPVPKPVTA